SNKTDDDSLPAMSARAAAKQFVFPYLRDESQRIAKEYGAGRTPEFFVLDKQRRIVYMGSFDDNTRAAEVKTKYVEQAIAATFEGKPVAIPRLHRWDAPFAFNATAGGEAIAVCGHCV
ncbi:MAG: redoxin family protein, partial [Aureliella sp.]